MKLSPNFTLAEFTNSQTALRRGISNTPDESIIKTLIQTAEKMEAVRTLLGHPISVNSAYRSPRLNAAIGGSTTSDHMTGHAVDFVCHGFGSPIEICKAIVQSDIIFGQLIYEGTWVHISFNPAKHRQVLTAKFGGGKVKYLPGLLQQNRAFHMA